MSPITGELIHWATNYTDADSYLTWWRRLFSEENSFLKKVSVNVHFAKDDDSESEVKFWKDWTNFVHKVGDRDNLAYHKLECICETENSESDGYKTAFFEEIGRPRPQLKQVVASACPTDGRHVNASNIPDSNGVHSSPHIFAGRKPSTGAKREYTHEPRRRVPQ